MAGAPATGFTTVTVEAAEVVTLFDVSRARACKVWVELVASALVSHVIVYGGALSSLPTSAPSTMNCTPATPWLSLAAATTDTVPCTVAELAGELIDTDGGTVSALNTDTVTPADVVRLPAASRATAVNVCVPFAVSVEFQAMLYGLVVSSAPTLTPSILNCTPATLMLSLAVADTVTALPEMFAPLAGAVSATVGIIRSGVKMTSTA